MGGNENLLQAVAVLLVHAWCAVSVSHIARFVVCGPPRGQGPAGPVLARHSAACRTVPLRASRSGRPHRRCVFALHAHSYGLQPGRQLLVALCGGTGSLHERVLHELQGRRPGLLLLVEAVSHEVEELKGHVPCLKERLQGGVLRGQGPLHDGLDELKVVGVTTGHRRRVRVGASRALEGDETNAPHVRGEAVPIPHDALGGHIVGGPDKGASRSKGGFELSRYSKVGQLHLALGGEEDVGGLEIAVELVLLLVQVDEPVEHLQHDLAQNGLRYPLTRGRPQHALKAASIHVLEGEVDDALEEEGVV
mmetsp:Transcript_6134/g.16661  ORF Transcript_6134/g.16661 Transcript_6134/m.16661 type:complete len:307 (-) Transcript_6134:475-1395(-)